MIFIKKIIYDMIQVIWSSNHQCVKFYERHFNKIFSYVSINISVTVYINLVGDIKSLICGQFCIRGHSQMTLLASSERDSASLCK